MWADSANFGILITGVAIVVLGQPLPTVDGGNTFHPSRRKMDEDHSTGVRRALIRTWPPVGGSGRLEQKLDGPPLDPEGSGPPPIRSRAMDKDFSTLSDPDFLAERKRVRETIEALTERLARLDDEFIRRASASWQEATR